MDQQDGGAPVQWKVTVHTNDLEWLSDVLTRPENLHEWAEPERFVKVKEMARL